MISYAQKLSASLDDIVSEMLKLKASDPKWDELSREYILLNVKIYSEELKSRIVQTNQNYNKR